MSRLFLKRWRLGRFELRILAWRHPSKLVGDRYVIQPSFIYDCKEKK